MLFNSKMCHFALGLSPQLLLSKGRKDPIIKEHSGPYLTAPLTRPLMKYF